MPRRWSFLWASLIFLGIIRVLYSVMAFPNSDEAYYWLWGCHLDWSYYDHPPLHAWLQGLTYRLLGRSPASLRLPTWLSSGLIFYVYAQLARYLYGARAGSAFSLMVAVILASPLYFLFLTMAWQDQWLVAFALLCAYELIRFGDAYAAAKAPAGWPLYRAGLALGLACLAKYTAVFVGLAALIVIVWQRPLRPLLRDGRLWGSGAIALLTTLPIFIWNHQNHWLSFQYYATRSLDPGGTHPGIILKPLEVLSFWGLSILILSPLLSYALYQTLMMENGKRKGEDGKLNPPAPSSIDAFSPSSVLRPPISSSSLTYWPLATTLFWLSTLTLSGIALFSTALYYWNILAYLLLLPALPTYFWHHPRLLKWHQGLGCTVALLLLINYCGFPLAACFGPDGDPDGRMLFGWSTVAPMVAAAAADLEGTSLLLTTDYRSASALAYALNDPSVLAISERQDQFDVWAQRRHLRGENALLLADDWHPLTPSLAAQFERLEAPVRIPVTRWGRHIKTYYLYRGFGFEP